ncbi:MAG: hypothetical protein LBE24_10585 [Methylobacillus sp.]|nr:hypothetical protein [Methylobacillus sp.]
MSYPERVVAARRLAILLAIYFAPAYTLNRLALRDTVEKTGYVMSSDLFTAELAWLEEMGLIEGVTIHAVTLTERGADVALGRSQTPGVRRPGPGEINGAQ